MFISLTIQNFRGFRDFTIRPLERLNLIGGANDVGKTALLEALYLLLGQTNVTLAPKISAFRGLDKYQGDPNEIGEWFWTPLFHKFNAQLPIRIEGQLSDSTKCSLELRVVPRASIRVPFSDPASHESLGSVNGLSSKALEAEYTDPSEQSLVAKMVIDQKGFKVEPAPPSPFFPGYFLSARGSYTLEEDAKNFGDLLVKKEPYDFLETLKIVEPRLTNINTILSAGGTLLYGDIGAGRMLPLALMGDGLARLTSILVKIATAQHGVVLIDEIENGLHYTVLSKVWSVIADAARRFDVQVFATTHSWECIQAAHHAFEESGTYDFRLHRLDRVDNEIRVATYDQEMLATAIATGLEVR